MDQIGLVNLTSVGGSLYIIENSALPANLVTDLNETVTIGGDEIVICGNLGDDPC